MGLAPCFPAITAASCHNKLQFLTTTGRDTVQKAPGRWGGRNRAVLPRPSHVLAHRRSVTPTVASRHYGPTPAPLCYHLMARRDSNDLRRYLSKSRSASGCPKTAAGPCIAETMRFSTRSNKPVQWVASPELDILPALVLPLPGAVLARDERDADVATCATPACAPEQPASRQIVRLRLPTSSPLPDVGLPKNSDAGWPCLPAPRTRFNL
jgi:hypothetical protein